MPNATFVAFLAIVLGSLPSPGWAESPKTKMTTTLPPGIASPDKVETRLGTLNFFDGKGEQSCKGD